MTKKREKTSPSAPGSKDGQLVDDNSLAEVKKVSRWKTVDIEQHELKDGKVQGYLIGDGVAYEFWTHAYQNLEMTSAHADKVRKRLIPEKHLISISKEEMRNIYPVINEALMINNFPSVYYFLTEEGHNRSILEVSTGGMKDREIAARIERRKDEMASVFTKYKRGELVPVAPPVIKKIQEKRDEGTILSKQIGRLVKNKLMPEYAKRGLNPHTAFSSEHRAINIITNGEHEADLKYKLNSDGLEIHNATKLSECVLLEADILDDDTRWNITDRAIHNLYPDKDDIQIKLTERETALVKRGCNENQKSLLEFKQSPKQISAEA